MENLINTKKRAKITPLTKHYFASANTAKGFDNLFDHINDPTRQGFLYILKGGPGTGKSTLMKTIAKTFLDSGEDIEYFYCSSDYTSLDGVRLSRHNIAIVDGTAPHVTEAKMPGVKDRIVNLGEFIGSDIKSHEAKIAELLAKKRLFFELAYIYIREASQLTSASDIIYKGAKKMPNIKGIARKTVAALDIKEANAQKVENDQKSRKKPQKSGSIRRLYQSAVALDGIVDISEKNKYSKIITLEYNNFINNEILEEVKSLLVKDGTDIIAFSELLNPASINSIAIPSINTLITKPYFGSRLATKTDKELEAYLEFNANCAQNLLKKAATALTAAKKQHKKIEAFYIPNMDFASISTLTQNLITEITDLINN